MDLLEKYNRWIKNRQLDHIRLIQSILLVIVIIILFMYLWLILLTRSEFFTQEFFIFAIRELTRGLIFGGIGGIVFGFLILLRPYIRKQWNIHVIAPNYLLVTTFIIVSMIILGLFLTIGSILKISITIGFALGLMIALLAYIGEVKKEHPNEV